MSAFKRYWAHMALSDPKRVENIVNAIKSGDKTKKQMAANSIQAFMNAPIEFAQEIRTGALQKNAIQAFTTTADLPDMVTRSFDVFNRIANYDLRWQEAFKERTFDDSRNYFEILDITNYFEFNQLPQGQSVTVRRVTGNKATVNAVTYADALGWTEEMLEDRMFSEMVDMAEQFQDAFWNKKSKVHYNLLVDASSPNFTAWQTTTSGTTPAEILKRDVDTINQAAYSLTNGVKDLGFGDVASAPLLIYGSPLMEARVTAALQQRIASAIAPSILGSRPIKFMPTYNLKSSNGSALADWIGIMVLPGNKIQRGDKLQPKTYLEDDALSFSKIQTVRARFGAAVAEPLQLRQFALST